MSSRIKVGVLRGGPSKHFELSLSTGSEVLKSINNFPDSYEASDIFVDKNGIWHLHGKPKNPERVLRNVDFVFNALHGEYGEDGEATRIIESHSIPHSGSSLFAHAMTFYKHRTKDFLNGHDIKRPYHFVLNEDHSQDAIVKVFREIPMPVIVKPVSSAHSYGVFLVSSFGELENAIKEAFKYSPSVLIEEYIGGVEVSCGVLRDFRGEDIYAFFPTEIERPLGFLNVDDKHKPSLRKWSPARISKDVKEKVQELSKKIHDVLHLGSYSKSDFIVHPKRGVVFLEVNTLPNLNSHSEFVHGLEGVGLTTPQFIDHLIKNNLK